MGSGDRDRPLPMMSSGEGHDQGLTTEQGQVIGSDLAMVPIETGPPGQGQSQSDQHGGEAPANQAEPGMTFPDVVEKRRTDDDEILLPGTDDHRRGVIAVTLLRIGLGKEHVRLGWVEPFPDRVDLIAYQRLGKQDIEETTGEMAQRARHSPSGP